MKNNKDKSLKKTMKSWIMLSENELDAAQAYEEQEAAKKASDISDDVDRKFGNGEAEVEENTVSEGSESYDSELYSDKAGLYSDKTDLYSDRAGLYSDIDQTKAEPEISRRLSRDEEINQLMKEVGQEVVDDNDEEVPAPRRRRKRHKDKKKIFSEKTRSFEETDSLEEAGSIEEDGLEKESSVKDADSLDKAEYKEETGSWKKTSSAKQADSFEKSNNSESEERLKRVDFPDEKDTSEKMNSSENTNKTSKSGGMGKAVTAGIGILLVLIIGGLGYQNQSLQRQNQKLKTEISQLEKDKKQAEKDSEEQALQTKNEDGVVVNTDKMFAAIKVGDKEYKLLCKVSDFTKDGWKLEALRTENATLVPGGKLEKDAFLTNTDGKKIGVIIRNMSDKNQKVSDCIITKLSFSKEMFDEQITLPESLGFASTEKELKAAGFKKDADGYCYTSKKIKDDNIKMTMADGESISDITLERTVDESTAATGNSSNTSSSTTGTTETGSGSSTDSMNNTDNVNSITEMN